MDWIDPRYAVAPGRKSSKSSRNRGERASSVRNTKPLSKQVTAALAQPANVWAAAYDHALSGVKWPEGCTVEATFLWSTLMQEQAEILVRAGMSAQKLAAIVAEKTASNEADRAEQLAGVIGLMEQSLETQAFEWLDTADAYPKSALGVAALAWYLPEHAQRPGNEWLKQWLESVVDRVSTYVADLEESVICHLVLQCELPLLVGVATSASQRTALEAASQAMDNLAEHLERGVEQPAPWLAHGATYLRASLASVIRCRVLANSLGMRKWYPPQRQALAEILKHAARWARPDGSQLLAAGLTSSRSGPLWEVLCKQTKRPQSSRAIMALSGLIPAVPTSSKALKVKAGRIGALGENLTKLRLPELTYYCDDAAGVCMQSDWRKKGSRFALDFSDSEICIEALGPKGKPVLAGEWTTSVELEDQSQLQLDEWTEVCWFQDDEVDYLELEARFGQHARVQRQAILFREERFLLLADALLGDHAANWSLSSRMPLAGDALFEPTKKTTEGFIITAGGGRCLTLPLNLPEWRQQVLGGGLDVEHDTLVAHQQGQTQRLYVATLFSLCNSHAKKPYTWRRLTVGEDLRIVGPEEAVAFRVQIGKEQWVLYRSLAQAKRRTAIGMHTVSEFFVGRLDVSDGEIDPLLLVDATA